MKKDSKQMQRDIHDHKEVSQRDKKMTEDTKNGYKVTQNDQPQTDAQ